MSRVDVVIPCFNYGHFLRRCVDSVLGQDGVEVRVLIIDDCSTDGSASVATRIGEDDPRVHVRLHEHNLGHIATYNEGLLGWADGDYVVLLSADDLLAPGALRRAAEVMDRDASVGMVYGHAPYFEFHDQIPPFRPRRTRVTTWRGADWIERRCRRGVNVISSPEVVMRTTIQHRIGGYQPDLPHAGDLEMWLRVAAVSNIAYVRGVPQAYYRVHGKSMQRTTFAASLDDLTQRRDVFAEFFARNGGLVPEADRLLALVNRRLAREALWRACRAYDRDDLELVPVDGLVQFAEESSPDAHELVEYRALLRRRRLGAPFCHRTQLFAVPAALKRAQSVYRFQRWVRRGT